MQARSIECVFFKFKWGGLEYNLRLTSFYYLVAGKYERVLRNCWLSKVIGAIDGALILIRSPHEQEHLFVCHKGYHAINVMAVCNAKLKFTNVVARWHGSAHDSAVFNSTMLQIHMESGGGRDGWLLGDRGYALTLCMVTPFRPNRDFTPGEKRYQKSHTVQLCKWSRDRKWSPNWTANDPQSGPQMIPLKIEEWRGRWTRFFSFFNIFPENWNCARWTFLSSYLVTDDRSVLCIDEDFSKKINSKSLN